MFAVDAVAAAQYQNVFVAPQGEGPLLTVALSGLVFALGMGYIFMYVTPGHFGFAKIISKQAVVATSLLVVVSGLLAMAVSTLMVVTPSPLEEQVTAMNTNLQQKYDATLATPMQHLPIEPDSLTRATEYKLTFHDGTTGNYFVKWDKATSEPTLVTGPSPQ